MPRKDWSPSNYAVICQKHFVPSNFKEERSDTNSLRKHKTRKFAEKGTETWSHSQPMAKLSKSVKQNIPVDVKFKCNKLISSSDADKARKNQGTDKEKG